MKGIHITETRNNEGALILTTLIGDRYFDRVFYFYTKREAYKLFRQFVKQELTKDTY